MSVGDTLDRRKLLAALRGLRRGDFTVRLPDELSGIDGEIARLFNEVVRDLRKVHPGLPSIIITGYAEGEAVDGRPEDVMVLLKPFTPAKLSEAILQAV